MSAQSDPHPAMTTEPTPDLVARLTDEADLCRNDGADDIAHLLDEAADALSTKDEEIARLRSALKPFALAADDLDDKHGDHGSLYEAPATLDLTAGHLRTARTALEGHNG